MPFRLSSADIDHELLHIERDPRTGLVAVIAIHSTLLGPAIGGCRLQAYPSLDAAIADALRLAKTMTFKNAAAGLAAGGGKAVIVDDGRSRDITQQLLRFADVVDGLDGRYITAEDMGTGPDDMSVIASRTRFVAGLPSESGGLGDPSQSTARTVLGAIQHASRLKFGSTALDGLRVGVLGVGHVGAQLVRLLADRGANVIVADKVPARAARVADRPNITAGSVDGLVTHPLDVLAPCATGELIAPATVPQLACEVIVGAANNPLTSQAVSRRLARRGILYVPDFMANCGGIIQVAGEYLGLPLPEIDAQIDAAISRTGELLEEASVLGRTPLELAEGRVTHRLREARAILAPASAADRSSG